MHTEANTVVEPAEAWFDEETVKGYLIDYLKGKRYRIVSDSAKDATEAESSIVAIKSGQKELIEVKGDPASSFNPTTKATKKADMRQQARYWFSEALLTSFINFGRYNWSGKVTIALGLPDTERYQQIVTNLQAYFTANNLNLKVYMVAADGTVTEHYLNEHALKK